MDSLLGKGLIEAAGQDSSGPKFVAGVTTQLGLNDTDVIFSSADATAHFYLKLPPVAEARGRTFTFLKTDSGTTYKGLVIPHGWITSTLNGGDSLNWDGSTGFDMDAQWDHLVLRSNGIAWIVISNGIA